MNKTKTFVAAVAVPVALLAMAAQSASAATAPTTTAPGATVPAGYVRLVDDTNHITVTVPNTWTTVETNPGQSPTGTDSASILATAGTDLDNFRQTFVDGVWYAAYPYSPDPSVLMGPHKLPAGLCADITDTSDNVQPYSDGLFTGLIQVGTSCGSGAATWNLIVASPADQSFTAVVEVQTTDPQALQTVRDSFNFAAGAAPVATTTPGVATTVAGGVATTSVTTPVITPPVQTTTAVTQAVASTVAPVTPTTAAGPMSSVAMTDATLPFGPLQPTDVALRDDTGTIEIAVPAAWTATDTAPRTAADGTTVGPRIIATSDLATFLPPAGTPDTFSVPGVIYGAQVFNEDTMAVLTSLGMGTSCTDAGIAPYSDNVFTGYFQTWTNCGGGATEIITIAAGARDGSATVTLLIQLPTNDVMALQTVVSSFNFAGAGSSGTTAS